MKKICFLFFAMATMVSCSGDDSSASNPFVSNITIDGAHFEPSPSTKFNATLSTGIISASEGYVGRKFFIVRNLPHKNQVLALIAYNPVAANNETGIYSFGPVTTGERYANGSYNDGTKVYTIVGDGVSIEDLGSNKYKITFTNCKLAFGTEEPVSFTGSFEGKFKDE